MKRFWNQQKHVENKNWIDVKNHYEEKYYQNGHLKRKGEYINDLRVGEWIFYNRSGQVKK